MDRSCAAIHVAISLLWEDDVSILELVYIDCLTLTVQKLLQKHEAGLSVLVESPEVLQMNPRVLTH